MASVQRVTFGQLLRRHRLAARLTQEQLAALAGIGVRSIGDLERDVSRAPHAETLQLLADALGLTGAARNAFEAAGRRTSRTDAGQTPSSPSPDMPALVGRTEELALIARLLQGEIAPLLLFSGEPGIGKSRLLAQAAVVAASQGWRIFAGGCTRRSGQAPYEPLVSALVRETRRTPAARLRLDLQGCSWLVRLLPELLEAHVVPAPTWTLPPEQERRLMFDAVARYLANVAGPSGTLLLLDDLQWAEGDALTLLERLVTEGSGGGSGSKGGAPLRLLGAYRATEVRLEDPLGLLMADLTQQRLAMRHQLPLLTHDEASALLRQLWPEQPEGQQLEQRASAQVAREETLRRAEGLPFYLVSSARAFQEVARDQGQDQGQVSDATTSGAPIPASVAESVQARITALPLAARRLIEIAAVAGRVVPGALLLAVTPRSEEETLEALEALVHAGLLAEDGAGTYRFTHDLIRETVEALVGSQRRRTLHRRLGEELERQDDRDNQARHAPEIAAHFLAASEPRRALPAVLLAGDQALALNAGNQAEQQYRTALTLARELSDLRSEAVAWEKLGNVLTVVGNDVAALAALERAFERYQALEDIEGQSRALALTRAAYMNTGAVEQGLARLEPQVEALTRRGLSTQGQASLHVALAHLHLIAFHLDQSAVWAERAVVLARAADDKPRLAQALTLHASAAIDRGHAMAAVPILQEALHLAEDLGDPYTTSNVALQLARAYLESGRFAQGWPIVEHALSLAEQAGALAHAALVRQKRASFAFGLGQWDRARSDWEEAIAVARRLGAEWLLAGTLWCLAHLQLSTGDKQAERTIEEALAVGAKTRPVEVQVSLAFARAEVDLLAGRALEARRRLLSPDAPINYEVSWCDPLSGCLPPLAW
ncbi:MAG TPA: AAA family ATPase, partial [Ktedonobacterales bacterium]